MIGCLIRAKTEITSGYSGLARRLPRIYPGEPKKCVAKMPRMLLIKPTQANSMWVIVFMYDALHNGRPFGTLNVIGESNPEILAIEIDISLPAARAART